MHFYFVYCLKNEQEGIIRFKKLEARLRVFKPDITQLQVFFMASKSLIIIDQLILALIFQIWGYFGVKNWTLSLAVNVE